MSRGESSRVEPRRGESSLGELNPIESRWVQASRIELIRLESSGLAQFTEAAVWDLRSAAKPNIFIDIDDLGA